MPHVASIVTLAATPPIGAALALHTAASMTNALVQGRVVAPREVMTTTAVVRVVITTMITRDTTMTARVIAIAAGPATMTTTPAIQGRIGDAAAAAPTHGRDIMIAVAPAPDPESSMEIR